MRPKAYSYVRFSTPEQAKGDSYRRQLEKARLYAAKYGLELDERETFLDSGISAFSGSNAVDGQLAAFRHAVERGDIAAGSFLLVENLDRISRMAAWEAATLLGSIVQLGITIVALTDETVYSRETLSADPNALLLMVLGFMRAHQESAIKSERLRAAWAQKKAQARASGKPMTALTPAWLDLTADRSAFVVLEDRANIVRRIYSETLSGKGQHSIAETLNREGVTPWGRGKSRAAFWHRSYIKKLLENPAVIGTLIPHNFRRVGSKRIRDPLEPVPDYYPAIIDRETFDAVQSLLSSAAPSQRESKAKGSATVSSYLAGLARCPVCSFTMTRVNKGKGNGTPYFVCTKAKAGAGCTYHAVKVEIVETAIHSGVSWLCAQSPTRDADLTEKANHLQTGIEACDYAMGFLLEEIESGNPSRAIRDRLRAIEQERSTLIARLDALAATLQAATGQTVIRLLTELEALLNQSDVGTNDAPPASPSEINVALRALFSSVTVDYPNGALLFTWKHAPDASPASLTYAWPMETQN